MNREERPGCTLECPPSPVPWMPATRTVSLCIPAPLVEGRALCVDAWAGDEAFGLEVWVLWRWGSEGEGVRCLDGEDSPSEKEAPGHPFPSVLELKNLGDDGGVGSVVTWSERCTCSCGLLALSAGPLPEAIPMKLYLEEEVDLLVNGRSSFFSPLEKNRRAARARALSFGGALPLAMSRSVVLCCTKRASGA